VAATRYDAYNGADVAMWINLDSSGNPIADPAHEPTFVAHERLELIHIKVPSCLSKGGLSTHD